MSSDARVDALFVEIDKRAEELQKLASDQEQITECNRRVDVSLIYHDFALEGTVLSFHELNSSVDDDIVSDVSLIPAYEDVRNHKAAIQFARAAAAKRRLVVDLEFLKKMHHVLSTEICPRPGKAPPRPVPGQYRKDMPLHRLYFHEIAPPDKISYQMRKFVSWLTDDETKKMHPVMRAAFAHHKLISVYPWPRHSGKIARLVMNILLMHHHYPPAIVHAVERQRYYEVLRQSSGELNELVAEGLLKTLRSSLAFFKGETAPPE